MSKRIYLDYAATSPLRAEVRKAMLPWLESGNPSSLHVDGRRAKGAIDQARERVSTALGCEFGECLFTSGATESANAAIIGAAVANEDPTRRRVLISAAEHHCVLHTQSMLERLGYQVTLLPVGRDTRPDFERSASELTSDVLLIAVMHANNETGAITDVASISEKAHETGILVFSDAVQTFTKIPNLVKKLKADLIAVSAHKIGGPQGAGALYVKAGTKLKSFIGGGGQERELRGGTENVAGIVGFAAAVTLPMSDAMTKSARDALLKRLVAGGAVPTLSPETPTLNTHCHVRFPGVESESMLIRLDRAGVSASAGAACSSGSLEASHVLLAAGFSEAEAKEGLRFTLGPGIGPNDAILAADRIIQTAQAILGTEKTRVAR
jgi:cysteine desulfurase